MRAFLLALLAPIAGALAACAAGAAPSGTGLPQPTSADTREICRGTPVPGGWLTIDLSFSRTRCPQSGGTETGTQPDNVLTIWRYEGQPVGTVKDVCAQNPTPPGWVVTRQFRDSNRCQGNGMGIYSANVKTIKRES